LINVVVIAHICPQLKPKISQLCLDVVFVFIFISIFSMRAFVHFVRTFPVDVALLVSLYTYTIGMLLSWCGETQRKLTKAK
jgi:high-affinity K+ transport system ATPase subunit B